MRPFVLLLLTLPVAALAAFSGAANSEQLNGYTARYNANIKGFTTEIKRTLKKNDDGHWVLRNKGELYFLDFIEISTLQESKHRIQPLHYNYRGETISFNWHDNTAQSVDGSTTETVTLIPGTQDKLSYQLQLQLDLLNEGEHFTDKQYAIIDGGKIKQYQIKKIGEETLDTPLGKLNTVKLEMSRPGKNRKTIIWAAKDRNYLLVKLQRFADQQMKYSMDLRSYTARR